MASEKIAKLVDILHSKTKDGQPLWVKTATPAEFLASFPNQSVSVIPFIDQWNNDTYKIRIYNATGELIEDVTPGDMRGFFNDAFELFRELYEGARMQAMGVDAAVDEILGFLEKPYRPY